jgi:hypothetical protein
MDNAQKSPVSSNSEKKEPIELVKEVKKELSDYREPYEKEWRESDNAYYGKQHKTGEGVKPVKNHIFKIIEGEVPILTDSMPGTQVDADVAEKQVDAEILNKAISYVYRDQNLPLILPTLMRKALTSAPGYLYAFFNPDADGGEGKIEYRQLPWENVWLDGNAQTIEQAKRAHIEIPMRRGAIARTWPEKSKEILGVQSKAESQSNLNSGEYEDRDNSSEGGSRGKPAHHKAKDIVNYCETWIESFDLEDIPQEDTAEEIARERQQFVSKDVPNIGKWENHAAHKEDHLAQRAELLAQINLPGDAPFEMVSQTVDGLLQQNPQAEGLGDILLSVKLIDNHLEEHAEMEKLNPTGQRPKYKDGWRLIKSVGSVILYDGPNPDEREGIGHIPLVLFYGYKDDTIYGFSEVKNLLDPQRTLNDVDFREIEGLRVNTNPHWVVDHEAEVDENTLTNEPGIVIKKAKGTEVSRRDPGQVSPQLERRKLTDAEFIEDVSGINRESQGNMAASASGIAIQKLQTQAIGRIRLKDRYLQYYSMRRLAIVTAHLILVHWTSEKQFRLRSDNSQIEDVVFDPIKMQDLGYTISVSPGSMAGLDKDALNAFFLQLLDKQHITFEDFLAVAEFPKKELLLTRLKERMEQDKTLQQLQEELEALKMENASLLGLAGPDILDGEQKKVFEMASKQALKEKLIAQASQNQQQIQGQQPGVNNGQPENQGQI